MANRGTRKGKIQQPEAEHEDGKNPQKLLVYFLQERIRLRALKHLPVLVHFYKLLTTSLSNRITEQQSLGLTVPQCIELIRAIEKRGKTNIADNLTKSWEEFQVAWAGILYKQSQKSRCDNI